jgi:hypothetical protein
MHSQNKFNLVLTEQFSLAIFKNSKSFDVKYLVKKGNLWMHHGVVFDSFYDLLKSFPIKNCHALKIKA